FRRCLALERHFVWPTAFHGFSGPDADLRYDGRAELRARLLLYVGRVLWIFPGTARQLLACPRGGTLGGGANRRLHRTLHAQAGAPAWARPRAAVDLWPVLHLRRVGEALLRILPRGVSRAGCARLHRIYGVGHTLPIFPAVHRRSLGGDVRGDLPAAA